MNDHPADFDRVLSQLPVFPLPNLVLFPGIIQPLHIFEARYREMVEHCLADAPYLALALLKPGWEADYYGSPEVFPIACAGKIVHHERMADGRYNIFLQGFQRIAIEEFVVDRPYRRARTHLLWDHAAAVDFIEIERQAAAIRACLKQLAIELPEVVHNIARVLQEVESPQQLADFVAYFFIPDCHRKQRILEALDLRRRLDETREAIADLLLHVYSELHKEEGGNPTRLH
ncbi:MAG: ATP-dependent protease [Deltaproteobacteria bacterium]|nr:MAG: ATP-dependent protease [Deltaproteobacteria bacterium]